MQHQLLVCANDNLMGKYVNTIKKAKSPLHASKEAGL
jgi:hypothetical protein